MARPYTDPSIDEYLRERLMPVEGTIPHLPGIEMYGNSIPAGTVGGDLFEPDTSDDLMRKVLFADMSLRKCLGRTMAWATTEA